ncbi:MAG TPA: hypothetical protein VFL98_01335 [Candidatus Paceibacterota bacterium]|nr:hypothetical protein [Candidatus Paceibacterota bacterium]
MLSERLSSRSPRTPEQLRGTFIYERFVSASLLAAAGTLEHGRREPDLGVQERKHVQRAIGILEKSGFATRAAFLRDAPGQAYIIEFMVAFFSAASPEEAAAACVEAYANILAVCYRGTGNRAGAADFLRALHQVAQSLQPATVQIRRR